MTAGRAGRSALGALLVGGAAATACHSGPAAGSAARPQHAPSGEEQARTATSDQWAGTAPTRVEELFVGRFPGVRVVTAPGGMSVRIRGATTIHGSNAPLYILDGMPIDAPDGLISVNPQDVAKIEVLKDVGSTAYYGVRGANGVVLITTKGAPKPARKP